MTNISIIKLICPPKLGGGIFCTYNSLNPTIYRNNLDGKILAVQTILYISLTQLLTI